MIKIVSRVDRVRCRHPSTENRWIIIIKSHFLSSTDRLQFAVFLFGLGMLKFLAHAHMQFYGHDRRVSVLIYAVSSHDRVDGSTSTHVNALFYRSGIWCTNNAAQLSSYKHMRCVLKCVAFFIRSPTIYPLQPIWLTKSSWQFQRTYILFKLSNVEYSNCPENHKSLAKMLNLARLEQVLSKTSQNFA